ncbi:MAG: AbrB/MazE/SpoVT family DNA-binding domain-containing protein [Phormidesmis sp. RL_2_1]|nr:AbrB/MazE/SpoVT family DNA-binding domain-containing protein [Phormidesmis sp. RL_2_1]
MVGIKIRKVGNSLGVTFPKDLLEELNIQEGDELYLIKTERGFELTPYNPEFASEIEAYRHVARRHRNALRELSQ